MKLTQRLLVQMLAIVAVLVGAVVLIIDHRLHRRIVAETTFQLSREAKIIAVEWTPALDPDWLADRTGAASGHRVTLISPNGTVIGDTDFDGDRLGRLENHRARPEVVEASRSGIGSAVRASPSTGEDQLYVAVRAPLGIARVSVTTRAVEQIFYVARRDVLIAGAMSLALAIGLAGLYSRAVSRPIVELRDVAMSLAAGNLSARPTLSAPGEVGDLARALTALGEQLGERLSAVEAEQSRRRDFVANVSHELRTPLTVVGGFAETLMDPTLAREKVVEFAGAMLSHSRRMQRLVNDLLDLSRIESGAWSPKAQEVLLPELLSEITAGVSEIARDKGIDFRIDVPRDGQLVWADRVALSQILLNLLENAVRHTNRGRILVRAGGNADGVEIKVEDTGAGIAPEHLPRIFERFYRADPGRARETGGTGLGLAIVKHLIESHGGRVTAHSVLGEGTAIGVFLPNSQAVRS